MNKKIWIVNKRRNRSLWKERRMIFKDRKKRTKSLIKKWEKLVDLFSERFKFISKQIYERSKEDYLNYCISKKGCLLADVIFEHKNYRIWLIATVYTQDHRNHHGKGQVNMICSYKIGHFFYPLNFDVREDYKWLHFDKSLDKEIDKENLVDMVDEIVFMNECYKELNKIE